MQKNVCKKRYRNCTQQVTSACTMRQNLRKKSTRMVHNRLRLRVTVLCSKMSAKQNTRTVQKDNLSLKYYHDKKEMQESNKTQ